MGPKQYVKKDLVTSWKVHSPLDLIEVRNCDQTTRKKLLSLWKVLFCPSFAPQPKAVGPKQCVKKKHKLKSLSPSRPDRSITIATKQPEKMPATPLKSLFCPSSTQKVSKKLYLVGAWSSEIASSICYVYLVPRLGSLGFAQKITVISSTQSAGEEVNSARDRRSFLSADRCW